MTGAWGDDMADMDREPEPPEHLWHERVFSSMKLECCVRCGFLKNYDQPNKPCPGWVRVGTRTEGTSS